MVVSALRWDVGRAPPVPFRATMYGDRLAEVDLGAGGGAMRISDKGSGEIESEAELSWLLGATWRLRRFWLA